MIKWLKHCKDNKNVETHPNESMYNLREKATGYEKDDKDKGTAWSESMYNSNT